MGGGAKPKPGEISLAHGGVLFLDELPEYSRKVLDVLREPLESGRIVISRASRSITYPANFQLIAAMNPCPCGYFGDPSGRCQCAPDQIRRYQGQASGPLLDRIDLHVEVTRPTTEILRAQEPGGETSRDVAARVENAWQTQLKRAGTCNARLEGELFEKHCTADERSWALLEQAANQFNLSARAHQRVLRVARTIADLAKVKKIAPPHVAEALSLRCFDRRV